MGIPLPDTGSVTEDVGVVGGFISTSGDVDYWLTDDTGEWTAETIAGTYGTLVIDEDGNWSYTAANANPSIQELDAGESLTEVFTITSAGGTTTVTITIRGADEPPCFTAGTLIDTPGGPRPVETLRAGDLVLTRDHGARPIRWIGSRRLVLDFSPEARRMRPIRMRKGCLGPGLPARDLTVSPMHRVLIAGGRPELLFGQREVLCAAGHLVNGQTILRERPAEVEYFHMLFDRHEIVTSHGCASESFYPGTIGLAGFADETREEVLTLFPDLRALPETYGRTAREVLKRHEAGLVRESLIPASRLPDRLRLRATVLRQAG